MNRYIVPLTMIAALSFPTAGCDKAGASEEQKEMKATEQAAAARNEAQEKVATAQAQADKDIAAAQTDFAKTRENYRHARWTDVADLDKKVVDLQAKQQTATGRTKAELDAVLPTIRAKRDVFARDMQALDSATGSTWDQAKVNLDKEWESLKATVDGAP
jgi:hypothetical protein